MIVGRQSQTGYAACRLVPESANRCAAEIFHAKRKAAAHVRPLCRSHQTGEESVLVEFPAFARGLIARLSAFTAVVEPTSDDVNDGLMIFCGPSRNDQRDAHSRVGDVLRGSGAFLGPFVLPPVPFVAYSCNAVTSSNRLTCREWNQRITPGYICQHPHISPNWGENHLCPGLAR